MKNKILWAIVIMLLICSFIDIIKIEALNDRIEQLQQWQNSVENNGIRLGERLGDMK